MSELKEVTKDHIRNIGIIAHIDAGKTTTTEGILYFTGKKHKIGKIDEGNTEMDWMEQERERGITIVSAATTCYWETHYSHFHQDVHRINIIDTPGHVDFTVEVERSLRVLDGAVVLFDGKMGVEPQSETVWRQADKYGVPRICLVNKLNQTGGDFYMSLESIRKRLNPNAVPIQLPIGEEQSLRGVVDLVSMKAYTYKNFDDAELIEEPIPADLMEKANKYHAELIEAISEADDRLLEKYLNGQTLTEDEIRLGIRKRIITGNFYPVMGGDCRGIVVTTVLDAIVDYLPSPLEAEPAEGVDSESGETIICKPDDSEPFVALAFKIQSDAYVGRLTYIRVYSGTLKAGDMVNNQTKSRRERVGRILLMHANSRSEVPEIKAGEIGAVVGLKDATTGNTLTDDRTQVVLETIRFPEPVISVAIEPKTKADQEKMGTALNRLSDEDPTFRVRSDEETGQTIISGMGELHLEIIVDRMKREFNVEANVGNPQVAYKETIKKMAEQEGRYIRQSGGHGQYGHCYIRLEPQERGKGFEFIDKIKGGSIPKEFIPAIGKGVEEAMQNGVLAGYPVIDVKVTLIDGSFHEVDSSEMAFKIAGSMAAKEGMRRAGPTILEPIMKVEVTTPEEFMGDAIGDLNSKRARIEGMFEHGTVRVIQGVVPLSEMFGYATKLRSISQGRAFYTMEPSHYEEVPAGIAAEIMGDDKVQTTGKRS